MHIHIPQKYSTGRGNKNPDNKSLIGINLRIKRCQTPVHPFWTSFLIFTHPWNSVTVFRGLNEPSPIARVGLYCVYCYAERRTWQIARCLRLRGWLIASSCFHWVLWLHVRSGLFDLILTMLWKTLWAKSDHLHHDKAHHTIISPCATCFFPSYSFGVCQVSFLENDHTTLRICTQSSILISGLLTIIKLAIWETGLFCLANPSKSRRHGKSSPKRGFKITPRYVCLSQSLTTVNSIAYHWAHPQRFIQRARARPRIPEETFCQVLP